MMIDTERLILQPFNDENKTSLMKMFQTSDFMAHSPYGELTADDALTRFNEVRQHFQLHGFAKMAMVLKSTKEVIGYCGFETCNINNQPYVELGFRLISTHRRKGYVVEAANKLIEDIKNRQYIEVIAFSENENKPAHHLLQKLGFVQMLSSQYLNMDVIFFKKEF